MHRASADGRPEDSLFASPSAGLPTRVTAQERQGKICVRAEYLKVAAPPPTIRRSFLPPGRYYSVFYCFLAVRISSCGVLQRNLFLSAAFFCRLTCTAAVVERVLSDTMNASAHSLFYLGDRPLTRPHRHGDSRRQLPDGRNLRDLPRVAGARGR